MVTKRKRYETDLFELSRGQLNIDLIIQEAIVLLNKYGINQLSMRKLADALGIRAASLYYHVKDKTELLQFIAEDICNKVQIPDSSLPWQEQILRILNEYRSALLKVSDSAEILLDSLPFTPKRLQIVEAIFRILLEAGLPPEEVVMFSTYINNFALSFVRDEMRLSNMAKEQGKTTNEIVAYSSKIFRALPKDQYPSAVFISDFMLKIEKEKEFHFGVKIVLDSIEERINKLSLK